MKTPRTDAAAIAAPEYATPGYVHSDFARELERENTRLRDALARCLPIVQADAQMMADISRFAPLDHAAQAKHDTTEYESERLTREIPFLLGLPNPMMSGPEDNANPSLGSREKLRRLSGFAPSTC